MVYCTSAKPNLTLTAVLNASVAAAPSNSFDVALNQVIYPLELCTGFLCQLLNLRVLHRRKIRSLAYTVYLKALSITYLVTIPLLATSVLRKLKFIDRQSYVTIFYYAHFEYYIENVLLFSGNLIVAALAAESLRGMLKPFESLLVTRKRSFVILSVIFFATAVFLSPLPFTTNVEGPDADGEYCVKRHNQGLFKTVHHVSTTIFEALLLLVVTGLYLCLFVEYRRIVVRHKEGVQQLRHSRSSHFSNSRKAVVICLASVTAYLLSNSLSSVKETLYLVRHLMPKNSALHRFFRSPGGNVLRNVANITLLFNFTLTVLLQYFASRQYREQANRIFGGRSNYVHKPSMSVPRTPITPRTDLEHLELQQPLNYADGTQEIEYQL